jgi:predicted dehydrogenase/nucleoside-diphosphate-sugar epimerase
MNTGLSSDAPVKRSTARSHPLRVGLVGTGYIAEFHARGIRAADGIELISVCDTNLRSARSFASQWGVPSAYASFESMLREQNLDAVHVLVPPDGHHLIAKMAMEAGVHVFLEKPMCVSVDEADDLVTTARDKGLLVAVNHNFLFSDAYQRMREAVRSGQLGPLDYVSLNHFFELGQIRFGPYDSWMLRDPKNAFLEIGPHLLSAAIDLVGEPDRISVAVDRKTDLPAGARVFRRWRIQTSVGRAALDINVNLGPGFPQRTINTHGLLGTAAVDFDANTCVVDRRTPLSTDFDRFRRSRSLARQFSVQARATLSDYIFSRIKLRRRGNPYQVSILDSIAAFYAAMRNGTPLDTRIDGSFGRDVTAWCTKIATAADIEPASAPPPRRSAPVAPPTVLVIGGAGFIGRELIRQLLTAGYSVRALMRNSAGALEGLYSGHLDIIKGDLRNEADLKAAMRGIEFVYHLATSESKIWEDSLRNIVEPTRLVGDACLAAGVKRLIYTGTIDSYYAGAKGETITEQTPLDRNITRRNYYARAKAASEAILMDMHRSTALPVVVFRPGIVIGESGSPFHWGVGRFSETVCEVWGEGNNKLPFVLVSDVAAGLIRGIEVDGIDGRSYNLVDLPLLSARDYLEELQRLAGINLAVFYRPIWRFYVSDLAKWVVKLAVNHPDKARIPSYRDWESRTQNALFDCTRARTELNWAPASNRQRIIDEGIGGSLKSWLDATS